MEVGICTTISTTFSGGLTPLYKVCFRASSCKENWGCSPDCVEKWCLLGSVFPNSHFVESHVFQIGEVEKHFVGSLGFKETEGFSL